MPTIVRYTLMITQLNTNVSSVTLRHTIKKNGSISSSTTDVWLLPWTPIHNIGGRESYHLSLASFSLPMTFIRSICLTLHNSEKHLLFLSNNITTFPHISPGYMSTLCGCYCQSNTWFSLPHQLDPQRRSRKSLLARNPNISPLKTNRICVI